MEKLIKFLLFAIFFLAVVTFILLKQPWFQDRLLQTALSNMAAPVSQLPEEDSLTAVVCGSRFVGAPSDWRLFESNRYSHE